MKTLWSNSTFWEGVGYLSLALLVFAQIAVGYLYLTAQIVYLITNLTCVVRDVAIALPKSNLVKDIVFSAISASLIAIYIF